MIPTARGVLLCLLPAPLLAASASVSGLRWAALVCLALAVGLLWLDWRAARPVNRFEITRSHDERLSLGADNLIRLAVTNRSPQPTRMWLRDQPPAAFSVEPSVFQDELAAWGAWTGSYRVKPLRRGNYRFGGITLRWQGPLRLVLRQGHIDALREVKVYPNLLDVRRYDLLLRRNRLQELGLRAARQFGQGTEFERLRDYLPDDDFRRIDWKATARRRRPITVEYETERSQTVMAVLDAGRMMQSPVAQIAKLDYAVNALLFLAYVASAKGDRMGLLTFADEVLHFAPPRQGRGQFYTLLELLYALEPQPVEPNYGRALSYLASKQRRRALVVIFTDLSGGIGMQALSKHVALLAQHSLPLVVTISDPDVHAAAQMQPQTSLGVYQRAAAEQWLDERRLMLDTLRRQGVQTLDTPANQLSTAVINRYLELKETMRL